MSLHPTRHIAPLILVVVLCILQYQIWFGRGNVRQVAELRQTLTEQQHANAQTEATIAQLQTDIKDLREGLATVEEKARFEMGMVKPNELFVQITRR